MDAISRRTESMSRRSDSMSLFTAPMSPFPLSMLATRRSRASQFACTTSTCPETRCISAIAWLRRKPSRRPTDGCPSPGAATAQTAIAATPTISILFIVFRPLCISV